MTLYAHRLTLYNCWKEFKFKIYSHEFGLSPIFNKFVYWIPNWTFEKVSWNNKWRSAELFSLTLCSVRLFRPSQSIVYNFVNMFRLQRTIYKVKGYLQIWTIFRNLFIGLIFILVHRQITFAACEMKTLFFLKTALLYLQNRLFLFIQVDDTNLF